MGYIIVQTFNEENPQAFFRPKLEGRDGAQELYDRLAGGKRTNCEITLMRIDGPHVLATVASTYKVINL